MLSATAQEYVSKMLDVYLEDFTTRFGTHNIGSNFLVWIELEKAGIVTLNHERTVAILNPDAVTRNAYPDD